MDWHADMSEKELEEFLHNGIPMTKQMGFSVKEFTPRKVRIEAKLEPNLNNHSTAFGGSINSLMTICGWSLVFNNNKRVDPDANLVIQKSSIEYKKPIADDFTAECEFTDEADRDRFLETYKRIGKARVEIKVLVKTGEETAADFRGYFVAFR